MIKLKIKQYITENNTIPHKILESLLEKQQVLLISAMKTGKTSFVMHYLVNKFRELNIQLIFISPTRSLLDNIQSKYKVIKCNGDVKSIKLNNLIPIVSTPDSLPKAIEACETGNKQFILVYDEAHQVIENISFREKLKNPFLIYKNDLCIELLAMTATPEPLENINFDQKFYIDVENKFYIANNTVIVKNFIDSIDSKLAFIRHVKSIHKDKTIFARINNKKDIKLLKDRLNNSIAWYRADNELKEGKEYIKHMEIFENTKDNSTIEVILNTYHFNSELWKVEQYQDLVKLWESQELEEYRERYRKLKSIIPSNNQAKFNEIELLHISLKKSTFKDFELQLNYINYNIIFDNGGDLEAINNKMLFVYEVRKYIIENKGKEKLVCLSKKLKLELLEHLKSKKSLSKLTPITLDKQLNMLYNISKNNQNKDIISSVKFKI